LFTHNLCSSLLQNLELQRLEALQGVEGRESEKRQSEERESEVSWQQEWIQSFLTIFMVQLMKPIIFSVQGEYIKPGYALL